MQRGRLLGTIGLSCLGVIGAGLVWYHSLKPSEPVALLERTYSARGQTDSISVASPDNYFGSQPTPSPLSLSSSHRRVDLSALVRLLSTGAAQNSALGYEGTVEQFPVSDDVAYSDLNDLFEPVYDDGVRVHSNSWGHPVASYDQLARSLDQFVWNHPDMVITVAGGNDGIDNDKDGVIDLSSLLSPAVAKNCITVGASENYVLEGGIQKAWGKLKGGEEIWGAEPIASDLPSDNPNGIAAFSSRGPTSDGRIKPDVVAPGTNVLSARSHHPKAETLWGEFSPDYVWSGGTSMATPLTAGAATLVRQFYTDQVGLTSPSAALIKATLINSADDIYPGQFGFSSVLEIPTPRPNAHEGWGRVNIGEAVSQGTRSIQYWDDAMGVKKGITKEYRVAVTDLTKPLRATLVYTDYPATTSAAKSLVNDLDLQVISSSGRKYFANGETTPDRTNNVEGIDILKPTKGEYIVRVVGYNIPKGKNGAQPYALVISGGF